MFDKKIWLVCSGIEPGGTFQRHSTLQITLVTPTEDIDEIEIDKSRHPANISFLSMTYLKIKSDLLCNKKTSDTVK